MTAGGAVDFGKELVKQYRDDDASGMGAELAYRWLFAVFPFGLFLAALGAFVAAALGIQNPAQQIINGLGDNLPAGLASTLQPELERVINQQRPGLVSIGAIAALWAATSGTMTVIKAMNRAYGVEENRPVYVKYGIGIGLTIAGAAGLLIAFVTIVGGALVTEEIASQFGLAGAAWTVISLLRWPIAFVLLVVAVAVLLRVGPNMTPSWRWTLVAGAVFAVGWLVATFGFALYVSNFSSYGATYGALAGVIVLMLWFYITAMILIAAGELVALLTKRTEPERLEERRKAILDAIELRGSGESIKRKLTSAVANAMKGDDEPDRPARPTDGERRYLPVPVAASPSRAVPAPERPRPGNETPLPVVAALSAAAAAVVAALTLRLPRR